LISFRACSHDSGVCINAEHDFHQATRYVLRDEVWDGTMCCEDESHAAYAVKALTAP